MALSTCHVDVPVLEEASVSFGEPSQFTLVLDGLTDKLLSRFSPSARPLDQSLLTEDLIHSNLLPPVFLRVHLLQTVQLR